MSNETAEKAWTQGQVRETFVRGREQHADFPGINNSRAEFERWLAAHDGEVRAAALKEAESVERCVHAVDGPDWAGLRELYPDTLCSHPSSRVKFDGGNRAVVCENCNMIVTHLGGGAVPSAEAERDALVVENAQLRGDLSENRRALDDAIKVANGNKSARDALQAENEKLRADLHEWETVGAPAWVAAKDAQLAEVWAERDALQARLDVMTVEWGVHWIPGDTYHDAPTEADAVSLAGEFVRSKARAVQRLVGPWTVVPEGDANA